MSINFETIFRDVFAGIDQIAATHPEDPTLKGQVDNVKSAAISAAQTVADAAIDAAGSVAEAKAPVASPIVDLAIAWLKQEVAKL
jgi:hypothetical protein